MAMDGVLGLAYPAYPLFCFRSKKLLVAPGLTTRNKEATRGSWHRYERSKMLVASSSFWPITEVSYAVSLYAEKRKSSAEDRGGSVDLAFFSGECTALAEDAMRLDRRAATLRNVSDPPIER